MATREDVQNIFPGNEKMLRFYDEIMAIKPRVKEDAKRKDAMKWRWKTFFDSEFFTMSSFVFMLCLVGLIYMYFIVIEPMITNIEVTESFMMVHDEIHIADYLRYDLDKTSLPYFISLMAMIGLLGLSLVGLNVKRWFDLVSKNDQ